VQCVGFFGAIERHGGDVRVTLNRKMLVGHGSNIATCIPRV
jgi:hypothetical protein